MNEDLEKLEKFFKYNMDVKKSMSFCAYNSADSYNEEYRSMYADKLFDELMSIKVSILKIAELYLDEKWIEYFKKLFNKYRDELINCGTDYKKLVDFYQNRISYMSPELVKKTRTEYIGYYMFNPGFSLLESCTTINEILHVLHTCIVNDEHTYSKIPMIDAKGKNEEIVGAENNIRFRGVDFPEARGVFEALPLNLDSGVADLIAFKDKMIFMARDLGHALTVEVDLEKDGNCVVRYFIPKICNYEMVRKLKGITPPKDGDRFAVGVFHVSKEELPQAFTNLVVNVPTDLHMFIPGGLCYRPDDPYMAPIIEQMKK